MFYLFLYFILLITASALCSMAEAAVLSLSIVRAKILVEQKVKGAKDVLYIKQNIADTVASIVILNNSINIIGSIFIGQQIAKALGDQWLGIASAFLTLSIIVAGEIIPKTIGERYKTTISLYSAIWLRIALFMLRPVVKLVMKIAKPFMKKVPTPKVTEDEIKMMLRLGRAEGTVEIDEELLCNRVFKLNDVRVMHIMKPIERIFALSADHTIGYLRDEIINSKYSRIAIYKNDRKNIIGMAQQRVLLREIANDNHELMISKLMTEPIFVNWFTRADTLLQMFQSFHQHLFIVQDAEKNNVGIVTMEDVLEELFGEIYDEKDLEKPRKFNDDQHATIISGIKDININNDDL